LIRKGAGRIHVCAPSNAAVDEIMVRLTKEEYGLNLDEMLLRVGAPEHEPVKQIKRYFLDDKLLLMVEGREAYYIR